LTGGKHSAGAIEFKNNMTALTDKSKLLSTQYNKELTDKLRLPKVYALHGNLKDKIK
jgi:hypothetical protein